MRNINGQIVVEITETNPYLTIIFMFKKLRTPYDIALARGEFELAEVLEGSMTAAAARDFYSQQIAALYGVRIDISRPHVV